MKWENLREKLLRDPEIQSEYERLRPYYEFIDSLVGLRRQRGITQEELARKVDTKQSAIARLESGNGNPTLGMIMKIADALNARIEIKLVGKTE